jgi:trans-aconitate methyltransferase
MNKNSHQWELWADFTKTTQREYQWAFKVTNILESLDLLPASSILDVGCGTGEFTSCFQSQCDILMGLDVNDYRENDNFEFYNMELKDFDETVPSVIIFKQSFHLIPNVFEILNSKRFRKSALIILQMPKPIWEPNTELWSKSPYNAEANKLLLQQIGKKVTIQRETMEYSLKTDYYKDLILGGYTSDLRKLSEQERLIVWNSLHLTQDSILYKDDLDIIIAT